MQIPMTWELYAASVILVIAVVVVFMLLRFVAILRTLQETQNLLFHLVGVVDPRTLLEMDLPAEFQPEEGGVIKN